MKYRQVADCDDAGPAGDRHADQIAFTRCGRSLGTGNAEDLQPVDPHPAGGWTGAEYLQYHRLYWNTRDRGDGDFDPRSPIDRSAVRRA